jgi:tetratricopeptide (TPR) repeat protein
MRFRMLETLREYAGGLLPADERAAVKQRHANYFVALIEEAESGLRSWDPRPLTRPLVLEEGNIELALANLMIGEDDDFCQYVRLVTAMVWQWQRSRNYCDMMLWLSPALAKRQALPVRLRLNLIGAAANMAYLQGDHHGSLALDDERRIMCHGSDDASDLAESNLLRGWIAFRAGEYAQARTLFEDFVRYMTAEEDRRAIAVGQCAIAACWHELGNVRLAQAISLDCLSVFHSLGDAWHIAEVTRGLGHAARDLGDHADALRLYAESARMFRSLGDRYSLANTLEHLGRQCERTGDLPAACANFEEAVAIWREMELHQRYAISCGHAAYLAHTMGSYSGAHALMRDCIEACMQLGTVMPAVQAIMRIARACADRQQYDRSARLTGAITELAEIGPAADWQPDRGEAAAEADRLRSLMSEKSFTIAWTEGRAMTIDQAVAYALEEA